MVNQGLTGHSNPTCEVAPSGPQPRPDHDAMAALLTACAVLHVLLLRSVPMDSDEPQHLHVVWAWSQGLVPYRDAFDNHAPLFHLLYAPVLRWIGETPEVMSWMRLAILPLSLLAIGCTVGIGSRLWDRRVGLWGGALAFAFPPYLLVSTQFRADALWAALWIASLLVAVAGRWTGRRAFWFGLLVGASFAASMKSTALLIGLAIAWCVVQLALARPFRVSPKHAVRGLSAMLAGFVVVPAMVVALVAAKGGLAAMEYGVISHNMLSGLGRAQGGAFRGLAMLVLLLATALAVRKLVRRAPDPALAARRCLVIVSAVAYLGILYACWPLLTRQDMLPCIPLLMIGLSAWLLRNRDDQGPGWAPGAGVGIGVLFVLCWHPPWQDRLAGFRTSLADVLALTHPGEPVMDAKGEAIYRSRPFYFVLEGVTLARIRRGLIIDDIPARLMATNTHLLLPLRLPLHDMPFFQANYVVLGGGLMAAGRDFGLLPDGATRVITMRLPARYAILGGAPAQRMSIDGIRYDGARWLGKGRHVLELGRRGRYALVWSRAADLFRAAAGGA